MATDVERLIVRLEGRIRDFERSMNRANGVANKTATNIERRFARTNVHLSRTFRNIGGSIGQGLGSGAIGGIAAGGGAFGLALVARGAVRAADTITEATNQIRAAFAARGITDNVDRVRDKLQDLAVETRSDFEATVQLFTRLTRATESINAPVDQVIRATEILNKAFQASGATAQEAANGVRQLAQGLASGALQGDELRSIRENAPVIAKAIADSFGVGIGALKELGAEGKLTAETVFPAILAGGAEIERQFEQTTATIGKAFGQVGTRLTEAVGKISDVTGAGANAASSLGTVAERIDQFGSNIVRFLDGTGRAFDEVQSRAASLGNSGVFNSIANAMDSAGLTDMTQLPEGAHVFGPAAAEAERQIQTQREALEELGTEADEVRARMDALGDVLDRRTQVMRASLQAELLGIIDEKAQVEDAIRKLQSLLGQTSFINRPPPHIGPGGVSTVPGAHIPIPTQPAPPHIGPAGLGNYGFQFTGHQGIGGMALTPLITVNKAGFSAMHSQQEATRAATEIVGSGVQNLGPEFAAATSGIPQPIVSAIGSGTSATTSALGSGFGSTVSAIGSSAATIASAVGSAVRSVGAGYAMMSTPGLHGAALANAISASYGFEQGHKGALGSTPIDMTSSWFTHNIVAPYNRLLHGTWTDYVSDMMRQHNYEGWMLGVEQGKFGGGSRASAGSVDSLEPAASVPSVPTSPSGISFDQLSANEAALRRFADAVSPTGRSALDGPRQVTNDNSVNPNVNVVIEGFQEREIIRIAEAVYERASQDFATRVALQ